MKKKSVDINNMKDKQRKKDHMYSDILGSSGNGGKVQQTTHKTKNEDLQISGHD